MGHSGGLDTDGNELPRLVYVSREKRPGFQHHKKAGAMNALVCSLKAFYYFYSTLISVIDNDSDFHCPPFEVVQFGRKYLFFFSREMSSHFVSWFGDGLMFVGCLRDWGGLLYQEVV